MPQESDLKDIIDVDVGTSFGYNGQNQQRFPSFSTAEKSSYNSPITSYDAPIAPSNNESNTVKKIRKVKKEKYKKVNSDIPFGMRKNFIINFDNHKIFLGTKLGRSRNGVIKK